MDNGITKDTITSGAERMRRYRERRRRGVSCVTIQLFETEISALITGTIGTDAAAR
jgi:hypothetical protein